MQSINLFFVQEVTFIFRFECKAVKKIFLCPMSSGLCLLISHALVETQKQVYFRNVTI